MKKNSSVSRVLERFSMICFIEAQCKKWEHNQVNAGFVKLVKSITDEECQFWGEKEHICNLKKMTEFDSVEIHEIDLPELIVDSSKNQQEYYDIFKPIFSYLGKYKDVKIIFLSAHKGIVLSNVDLAKEYPDYRIFLTMHSIMEQLYHKNTWFHKCYRIVLRGEHNLDWVLKKADDACPNLKFIIYVPGYKERINKTLPQYVVDKFIFMHHPYVFNNINEINDKRNNDAIAVIGAAVNKNAVDITKHCASSTMFNIVQRTKVKIEGKNVNILSKGKETTAKDIQECIDCSDWMLIPYSKNQYRLTASGIFWDSIANNKPIIALGSAYLKDYMEKYQIGIWEEKNKKLCERIKNLDKENYRQFSKEISKFIKIIEEENERIISDILLK